MLRIGAIGCGYWGPNLIRNFHQHPRSQVVTVCDLRPERLDFLSRQYPGVHTTLRPEEVLNDPSLDAVVISTPVGTHFDLASRALLSGKHVLVEKPMCATLDEGLRLRDLAAASGRVFLVDHTFVYTGAVRKIKEIIDSGELGEILYFDSVRINLGLFQHDVNVIWDLAPHDAAILDFLIPNAIQEVHAEGFSHFPNGLENIAYITVYFDRPIIAHLHVNWLAPVKVRQTLIGGSKKMIVYNDMENVEKIKIYDKGVSIRPDAEHIYHTLVQYRIGDMHAPVIDQTEALTREVDHFITCIETGQTPLTGVEAGLRVVEIISRADHSLREKAQRRRIKS